MAKYNCKCGKTLSNIMSPNNIELRVYTDNEWDNIINIGIMDSVDLPFPKYDVWRCPDCERIYVFKESKVIKCYILEQ